MLSYAKSEIFILMNRNNAITDKIVEALKKLGVELRG